jgi:hypothetical protein
MSDLDTYSKLELKFVRRDIGAMFLDELKIVKVVKVLKQAHID